MREDVPNVDLLSVEMNRGNESVFVTADIEDNIPVNIIRTAKVLLYEFFT